MPSCGFKLVTWVLNHENWKLKIENPNLNIQKLKYPNIQISKCLNLWKCLCGIQGQDRIWRVWVGNGISPSASLWRIIRGSASGGTMWYDRIILIHGIITLRHHAITLITARHHATTISHHQPITPLHHHIITLPHTHKELRERWDDGIYSYVGIGSVCVKKTKTAMWG